MKDVIWIIFNPLVDQVDDEGEKEDKVNTSIYLLNSDTAL